MSANLLFSNFRTNPIFKSGRSHPSRRILQPPVLHPGKPVTRPERGPERPLRHGPAIQICHRTKLESTGSRSSIRRLRSPIRTPFTATSSRVPKTGFNAGPQYPSPTLSENDFAVHSES
jgi:hypothetical protein